MLEEFAAVVGVLISFGLVVAPLVVLMLLLNGRDERQRALHAAVVQELNDRELRGRVTVRTQCALLFRSAVVRVDMRDCSQAEIWDAVGRLSRILPAHVRLEVEGFAGFQREARLVLPRRREPVMVHPGRL